MYPKWCCVHWHIALRQCLLDPCLQFRQGRLGVVELWRVDTGDPRHTIFRGVAGDQNLTCKRQHVGREAVLRQGAGIAFLLVHKGLRLVQHVKQVGQHRRANRQAGR